MTSCSDFASMQWMAVSRVAPMGRKLLGSCSRYFTEPAALATEKTAPPSAAEALNLELKRQAGWTEVWPSHRS